MLQNYLSEQLDVEWQKSVQGFQDEETEHVDLLLEDGQLQIAFVENEQCEDVDQLVGFHEGGAADVVVDKDAQEMDVHERSDNEELSAGHSFESLEVGRESLLLQKLDNLWGVPLHTNSFSTLDGDVIWTKLLAHVV